MRLSAGARFDVDAVLFDMDGTLVDSTAVVERLWREWAARHGVDPEAVLAVSHGRRSDDVIAAFAPATVDRAGEVARFVTRELGERDGIVPVPGAAALLAALPPNRVAVVTSAPRALAAARMAAAGLPLPDVLVGAEDVARGKPDPEGYRRAAARLGVGPARCLVVGWSCPALVERSGLAGQAAIRVGELTARAA